VIGARLRASQRAERTRERQRAEAVPPARAKNSSRRLGEQKSPGRQDDEVGLHEFSPETKEEEEGRRTTPFAKGETGMDERERNEALEGLFIVRAALRGALALARAGEEVPTSSRMSELAAVLTLASSGLAEVVRRIEDAR
jgi:hypothetical protein